MEEGAFTLRFVLPPGKTEASCSESLGEAFEKCQEQEMAPKWITHDEVLLLKPVKQDVFVIDPFEGEAFRFLSDTRCTIVGPRCLLSCLLEGVPVPALPYPMYTASLRDCVVTSTGFDKVTKDLVKLRVERMGGIYENAFHDGVTHLVAEAVKSKKYEVAIRKEIPIYTAEWLEKLWEAGKDENVRADDKRFLRYACPALKGLVVCISQMSRKDKETLRRKIESHGGIYDGVLDMEKTAILITPTTAGDKYGYARKWQIPCLSPDWIFDSIDRGHCLPTLDYRIDRAKVSTPTKDEGNATAQLQEVSMCSMIMQPPNNGDISSTKNVNESVANSNVTMISKSDTHGNGNESTAELLNKLELGRVKKAGLFLEGCSVFLSGFNEDQETQIQRVLHFAGAKRMNQITSSLTHVIMNAVIQEHVELLQKVNATPHKVSLFWVVESMQLHKPAPEEDFLYVEPLKASLKKRKLPAVEVTTLSEQNDDRDPQKEEEQYENDLLLQYKQVDNREEESKKEAPDASQEASCSQVSRFLMNKKLALIGFNEETEIDLCEWVTEAGGEFVYKDFVGTLDYLIVPVMGTNKTHDFKTKEVVSEYWINDCLDQGSLLEVEYYHRPITVDRELRPCNGVVIGITNYQGRERQFISKVAEALGMVAQEIFAKREKRGAKQSTHLVCATPEGNKYDAGLKWGLPIVNKDWLLACLREKQWVSERKFLVGNSDKFTEGKPEPTDEKEENSEQERDDLKKSTTLNEEEQPTIHVTQPDEGDAETPVRHKSPLVSAEERAAATKEAFETPAPLDIEKLRPKRLPENLDESGTPVSSRWTAAADSQPSPANLKRKREDEDLPYYLHGVQTPNTPYGAFLGDPNPSPKTRKFWKKQCEELGRYEMTADEREEFSKKVERIKRSKNTRGHREIQQRREAAEEFERHELQHLDPSNAQESHERTMKKLEERNIPVLGKDGKSFDDLMEEKLMKVGKSWKNPRKKGPSPTPTKLDLLKDVVVYVAKKLQSIQDEINGIVASLGGGFRYQYGPEVTHVIFSGKTNDLSKEFRQARKDGKFIVCPDWVYMSRDEGRRIEEVTFPHNFNPKMSLNVSVATVGGGSPTSRKPSTRKRGYNTQTMIGDQSEQVTAVTQETPAKIMEEELVEERSSEAFEDDKEDFSKDIAKMEELVEETSVKKRRSVKVTLTSTDASPERNEDDEKEAPHPSQAVEGESQVIQWKDPKEEDERQKLKERLAMETQALPAVDRDKQDQTTFQSMEMPENLTAFLDKENMKSELNSQGDQTTIGQEEDFGGKSKLCFMVSSMSDFDRQEFVAFLNTVGVQYSTSNWCDSSSTCLVAQRITRSEKMLGFIAAGKWVLHGSYATECKSAGKILPPASFEWGNADNGFLAGLDSMGSNLARAAFRWRRSVRRAFEGFRIIVHTGPERRAAFARLVELGGGEVVTDAQPPYSNPLGATHCLAEPQRLPKTQVDWRSLAKAGVAVVEPVFINQVLVSDPPPLVEDFLVKEFQPYWKKHAV